MHLLYEAFFERVVGFPRLALKQSVRYGDGHHGVVGILAGNAHNAVAPEQSEVLALVIVKFKPGTDDIPDDRAEQSLFSFRPSLHPVKAGDDISLFDFDPFRVFRVKDRILHHLVPNIMPQLIVQATMGMGGVILTESTLSFLGLGVKHPLATWGTIINSVSSASAMSHYAFIWIPVGLLICVTVIAFNFVGDGLRDAYDPKAKR